MKRTSRYLAFLSLITALIAVIGGMSSSSALARTGHVGRAAQAYGTPTPSTGAAMGTHTSVTRVIGIYSPTHPAPIVPIGAVTISRTTTPSGTLVVYQFGTLDYDVTYYPSGRYVYTEVRVAGVAAPTATPAAGATTSAATPVPTTSTSTTSTLPTTGGATPSTPSTPVVPVLLGLALAVLGVTTRSLSRMTR